MDVEIESSIDSIRDIQSRYQTVLRLARALASHFANVIECQGAISAEFAHLAGKETDLQVNIYIFFYLYDTVFFVSSKFI